ncbi:MAG TPA: hypothetical protein VF808_11000 [Ktedonobacterales bacterium]
MGLLTSATLGALTGETGAGGRGAGWRVTRHILRRIVAGGVGRRRVAGDAGRRMQMSAVTVDVDYQPGGLRSAYHQVVVAR